jgi:hypothetical protein
MLPYVPCVRMSSQLLPVNPKIVPHCFSRACIARVGIRPEWSVVEDAGAPGAQRRDIGVLSAMWASSPHGPYLRRSCSPLQGAREGGVPAHIGHASPGRAEDQTASPREAASGGHRQPLPPEAPMGARAGRAGSCAKRQGIIAHGVDPRCFLRSSGAQPLILVEFSHRAPAHMRRLTTPRSIP